MSSYDFPPAALICPPPLKYFLANRFTSKSPLDRNYILIKFSLISSIKITERIIPLILNPKLTNPSESPF